jgi:hypothetical protein
MIKNLLKFTVIPLLALMLVMSSCNHDRNQPGYAYMPDMYHSDAAEALLAYRLKRQHDDEVPVKARLRGALPEYPYKPQSADDQKRAGLELVTCSCQCRILARARNCLRFTVLTVTDLLEMDRDTFIPASVSQRNPLH